ncbi:MipD protein [Coprinopsis cinerea okayama7|uniref:RNA exonuclease 4 n=2 Tax=Coprinopsis cinerea TaxID=5346 RepID=A8N4S9_COPC7|nr:MipD protein [Coprinopsis cinerea okayama7\|eukprot:XP_001829874.1 MipD protein [Coprinopsis cinerea okayama7\
MSGPSSNWLKLQEQLKKSSKGKGKDKKSETHRKRTRTTSISSTRSISPTPSAISHTSHVSEKIVTVAGSSSSSSKPGRENVGTLQSMVLGHEELTEKQKLPGKYLALDCEMVGVGIDGEESSLARVSLVNFYGEVIMDEFVRQRERVVDYRTQWSGIRESDMVHAKLFLEVQKQVADLLKDRILVGHAVHNDLKALLLSHPYPYTRDTQVLAYKSGLTKSKRIALRNLVKEQIGLTIQAGEHSSVTDARATMAVYRLHKKEFDKSMGAHLYPLPTPGPSQPSAQKRKRAESEVGDEDDEEEESTLASGKGKSKKKKAKSPNPLDPGQGRKGVSSGLSTIIRRPGQKKDQQKKQWWKELPTAASGAKTSFKMSKA